MVKKLISIVAVAAMFFSASAQNARVDAMGGCSIIPDISRTLWLAADMNGYSDQAQGPATGATGFGPVIGIKGVGDMINLGFMANHGSVLRGGFYGSAESILEQEILGGNDLLPSSFPVYPHILFGLDLDAVSLGLDLFYKATRYKYSDEVGKDIHEIEAKISLFGMNISANIGIGDMSISPLFGLGFPRASGLDEDDAANTKDEVSTSGVKFTAGTEFGYDFGKINAIGGFFFNHESYQFTVKDIDTSIDYNENKESFLDMYLGLTTEILNGLFLVSQYGLTIGIDKEIQINNNDWETKNNTYFHDFRFGLERPIAGVWIFDELIPRGGLRYQIYNEKDKSSNSDGDTLTTTNDANDTDPFTVTAGIGLTKGIATVDIAIAIGDWDGVLTGPSVFEGTLTLDFGKSSRGASRPSSQTAPSPVVSEPASDETGSQNTGESSDIDFDF